MALFEDRRDAGRCLARALQRYRDVADVVVVGLSRGGMPVAAEVAHALAAPLDVCVVRKLGVPGHEELAMGAIASGGVRVVHEASLRSLGLGEELLEAVARREHREVERRERLFRGARPPLNLRGRCVILVDDGLATGATMRAAIQSIRLAGPRAVVMAVPVGSPEVVGEFAGLADEVICVEQPYPFFAVGVWYRRFGQVTDEQVIELLEAEVPPSLGEASGEGAAIPRSLP